MDPIYDQSDETPQYDRQAKCTNNSLCGRKDVTFRVLLRNVLYHVQRSREGHVFGFLKYG